MKAQKIALVFCIITVLLSGGLLAARKWAPETAIPDMTANSAQSLEPTEDMRISVAEEETLHERNMGILLDDGLLEDSAEDISLTCISLYNRGVVTSYPAIRDAEMPVPHEAHEHEPPATVTLIRITLEDDTWYTYRLEGTYVQSIKDSTGTIIYVVIE